MDPGTSAARAMVAQYALKCLEDRRNRLSLLPSSSSSVAGNFRQRNQFATVPKHLDEPDESDVTRLAQSILFNTRMCLAGSDEERIFFDCRSTSKGQHLDGIKGTNETIAALTEEPPSLVELANRAVVVLARSKEATAMTQQQPTKKRQLQGSASAGRGCRAAGCGRPLALTSSSYCNEHVGSTALCSIANCTRAAEGPEGPRRFCRLHMIEELERVTRTNIKTGSIGITRVQNPITVASPVAAPADYELPKGAVKRCSFDTCTKNARGASWFCIQHGGGKRCQFRNCSRSARGATSFCVTHGGGRRCAMPQCPKSAVGATSYCIAHGGGKRCQYRECTHSAEGGTSFCIRHGGGRRCRTPNCNKSAVGTTEYCVACGGGRRCSEPGCDKSAVGATAHCKAHGGGRRCAHPEGCTRSAQGASFLCIFHGGGRRCVAEGCTRTVAGPGMSCKVHGGADSDANVVVLEEPDEGDNEDMDQQEDEDDDE